MNARRCATRLWTAGHRGAVLVAALALGGCLAETEGFTPPASEVALSRAQGTSNPLQVTAPFVFDAQRILVEIAFQRPDGGKRRALAWLNMGVPNVVLASPLYQELAVAGGHPLMFRLGDMLMKVDGTSVTKGPGRLSGEDDFEHFFGPRPVEAILPAGVLKDFTVIVDYDARSVTLAQPGTLHPTGTPVAIKINATTGLITADATISGGAYVVAIEAGAPYSWFRGDALAPLLAVNPTWRRGEGAVGLSNAGMTDYALEKDGSVVRFPAISIGPVEADDVGALATAPFLGALGDRVVGNLFWDTWQKNAPRPVAGWIGNNVLKAFRVTVDYAGRTLYLEHRHPVDAHDLDQVAVSLLRKHGDYFISGIVAREGLPMVRGVAIGDRLVAVDGHPLHMEGRAAVLASLVGSEQVHHRLTIERAGMISDVEVSGASF